MVKTFPSLWRFERPAAISKVGPVASEFEAMEIISVTHKTQSPEKTLHESWLRFRRQSIAYVELKILIVVFSKTNVHGGLPFGAYETTLREDFDRPENIRLRGDTNAMYATGRQRRDRSLCHESN
jgi:hypothetical protein